jgi:signal transduction histidine kinase
MEIKAQYLHAEKLSTIGRLSASIAHEFNNPLQGIMTILKGLRLRATMEDEDREILDVAINESERMKNLIRSLQDFSRPSSGEKVLVDVHASIDSLLLLFRSDFKQKRISTVLNYAEELPRVMAIPDQIKQILLNLFHNAMDACWQSGGGLIEITTSHEEERITIAIKDSGLGIKAEEIDHIFEPFYTTKSVVGKGIGLGLSVCQEIVRNHQGEIRVESRPGEGATFAVLLPVFQK